MDFRDETAAVQAGRWVLDTNVVMALWHFRDPALARLQEWIGSGRPVLLTRPDCLDELQRVLAYSQFGIPAEIQMAILEGYRARTVLAASGDADDGRIATEALPRCGDRDDQKFLELAWEGCARFLVTRDKLLLRLARKPVVRERLTILTPEKLQQQLSGPESLQCLNFF